MRHAERRHRLDSLVACDQSPVGVESDRLDDAVPTDGLLQPDEYQQLAVGGDPVRLRLLKVYSTGRQASCAPVALWFPYLQKPTISHHLTIMREAGLVSIRAAGRNRYVRLRRDDPDTRFPGLLDAVPKSLPFQAVSGK
ncbi:ArsR/SmtB family transcription factor [Streptomyces sp. NPDC093261]|uniref:ArsR/SmtB family transcription factor n=1 Tax=Streptomyces sp. NPDC093261 TaxID=3366037 RepID=UPI00380C9B49